MVTIVKDNTKIVVTKDTFEKQYKPLGYQIASKENKGAAEQVAPFIEKEEKTIEKEVSKKEKEEDKREKLDMEFGFRKGRKGSK